MKEKTNKELKDKFYLTDAELNELEVIDKYERKLIDYSIFDQIADSRYMQINSKSFNFYYVKGRRVNKEEYDEFIKINYNKILF